MTWRFSTAGCALSGSLANTGNPTPRRCLQRVQRIWASKEVLLRIRSIRMIRCSHSPLRTAAPPHPCVVAVVLLLLITLTACGGGGGAPPPPPPATLSGTLAYVVSECRASARDVTAHQELRVQRGEQAPQTLLEFTAVSPVEAGALCARWGAATGQHP